MKAEVVDLERFYKKRVRITDYSGKKWYGVVDNITSAADNEEDDAPGEISVGLKPERGLGIDFMLHEIKSIEVLDS